jgi:hypothetical protein
MAEEAGMQRMPPDFVDVRLPFLLNGEHEGWKSFKMEEERFLCLSPFVRLHLK